MKLFTKNQYRWILPVALAGLTGSLSAQISLGVIQYAIDPAQKEYSSPHSAVEGQVAFSYQGGNLTLTTQIVNTGTNLLSGIYIMKPFDLGGTASTYNPEGYGFAGAPSGFSVTAIAGPEDDWSLSNNSQDSKHAFWEGFPDLVDAVNDHTITTSTARNIAANRTDYQNYYVGTETNRYTTSNGDRLKGGEGIEVAWSFSVGSLENAMDLVSNYTASEWPLVFARWNKVSSGSLYNWAKGWSTGPIIVVPEPSALGFLGFLLPIGLLATRRRRHRRN